MATRTIEYAPVHVVTLPDGRRFRRLTKAAACRAAARAVVRAACECSAADPEVGDPGDVCYLHHVREDGTRRIDELVDRLARLYGAIGKRHGGAGC